MRGGILATLVLKMEEKGYRKIPTLLFQNEPPRFYDRQRMGSLDELLAIDQPNALVYLESFLGKMLQSEVGKKFPI